MAVFSRRTAAFGASDSLPAAPAGVSLLNGYQPFGLVWRAFKDHRFQLWSNDQAGEAASFRSSSAKTRTRKSTNKRMRGGTGLPGAKTA